MKAGWALALHDVLAGRHYDVRVLNVLGSFTRKIPDLLLKQAASVFRTPSPFAKCLLPVVLVLEESAPAAERSIVLTTRIRYAAAALTIRWVVLAIMALAYTLFVVP